MDDERLRSNQSYYTISREQFNGDYMSGSGFQVNCAGEVSEVRKFLNSNESGRNDYYLMYMQGGELDLRVGELKRKLCAGQMICFAPHTPYSYNNHGSDEPIRYYWIHFTGSEASTFVDSCELPLGEVYHVGLHPEMDTVFENLFSEFRSRQTNFNFAIVLKVQYILFLIARFIKNSTASDGRLERSIKYIHEHFRRTITVSELADMEYLSVSRYRELFREVTGFSPNDYIIRQRIHRACDLLSQGHTLSSAAELTGYTDKLYFQRVFKKIMNMTPGAYKKKYN